MSNEFRGRRSTEKEYRAGGKAIAAGLQYRDEVALFRVRHVHIDAEEVGRVARGASNCAKRFCRVRPRKVAQGVVRSHGSAECAGRRQMVVQAAVDEKESLTARSLAA